MNPVQTGPFFSADAGGTQGQSRMLHGWESKIIPGVHGPLLPTATQRLAYA